MFLIKADRKRVAITGTSELTTSFQIRLQSLCIGPNAFEGWSIIFEHASFVKSCLIILSFFYQFLIQTSFQCRSFDSHNDMLMWYIVIPCGSIIIPCGSPLKNCQSRCSKNRNMIGSLGAKLSEVNSISNCHFVLSNSLFEIMWNLGRIYWLSRRKQLGCLECCVNILFLKDKNKNYRNLWWQVIMKH